MLLCVSLGDDELYTLLKKNFEARKGRIYLWFEIVHVIQNMTEVNGA